VFDKVVLEVVLEVELEEGVTVVVLEDVVFVLTVVLEATVPFVVALMVFVVLEVVLDLVLLEEEVLLVVLDEVELVELVLLDCITIDLSWVSLVTFFMGASSKSAIVATDSKAPLKEAVLKAFEVARTISTNTKEVTFIDYYFHINKLKY
jgi:hypothetical protein